jgi:hypothetical protein
MIRRVLACVALALALGSCELGSLTPPSTQCAGPCVADPVPHCVPTTASCTTGDDCVSGLNCTALSTDVPCATLDDSALQCRPLRSNRLALKEGFDAKNMDIVFEASDSAPAVTWSAPSEVKYVACALFSCAPEILGPVDQRVIVNFDTCVALFKVSVVDEGVFRVDDSSSYTGFDQRCTAATTARRVFNELSVGCWAYDDHQLIAATDLVPVPPATVRGVTDLVQERPCTTDGEACYDAATDTFGICNGATCSARCRTAADCGAWGLRTGRSQPGDACEWSCRDLPSSGLGACVREAL